jgi:hypothetical protein
VISLVLLLLAFKLRDPCILVLQVFLILDL